MSCLALKIFKNVFKPFFLQNYENEVAIAKKKAQEAIASLDDIETALTAAERKSILSFYLIFCEKLRQTWLKCHFISPPLLCSEGL